MPPGVPQDAQRTTAPPSPAPYWSWVAPPPTAPYPRATQTPRLGWAGFAAASTVSWTVSYPSHRVPLPSHSPNPGALDCGLPISQVPFPTHPLPQEWELHQEEAVQRGLELVYMLLCCGMCATRQMQVRRGRGWGRKGAQGARM